MPLDHYVTLGRSGLRVSPFCLGAMTFGEDLGWGSSVEESQAILDRYIELGGNFIDTANFYTKSHSEKIIGDLLDFTRQRDAQCRAISLREIVEEQIGRLGASAWKSRNSTTPLSSSFTTRSVGMGMFCLT